MITTTGITTTISIIDKILNAKTIQDVLDINNLTSEFRAIMLEIHPDKDSSSEASQATYRLNELRDEYENGKAYNDELGRFTLNGFKATFAGDSKVLQWSYDNFNHLRGIAKVQTPHILNYLPQQMKMVANDVKLTVSYKDRVVPLSGLTLPEEHSRWILSRMLEFSLMLYQLGFTHSGLNPESVFIVPETHGIIVTSFYHLAKVGNKVGTINGNYRNWYPAKLFTEKKAYPYIDLELCKKITINLLGDHSGVGIKLKKTNNEKFINFLIRQDSNPIQCYDEYRRLLKENFKSEFHILNI